VTVNVIQAILESFIYKLLYITNVPNILGQQNIQRGKNMENEFEKAEQEVQDEETLEQTEQTKSKEVTEIDVDSISEKTYLALPKADNVGKETPKMEIVKFLREPGRLQKSKDPTGDTFWTGLVKKGKDGLPDENQDEANLYVNIDSKEHVVQLKSWELFFKVYDFVKYCKNTKQMFKGQVISLKRINTGRKNANQNWELIIHSLKIKVVGVSRTESKVVPMDK